MDLAGLRQASGGGERSRASDPPVVIRGVLEPARCAEDRGVRAMHNKLVLDAWLPANWLSEWQPHNTCKVFFSQDGFL